MRVFLDFEASSLRDHGYPVEVGWAWEDGREEAHLIRPAPGWTDWDARAEAVHGLSRARLQADGEAHDAVARRMVEALAGAELHASAPSWDGKWLSALLRASGLPRHALRLRDTEDAQRETAREVLGGAASGGAIGGAALEHAVAAVLAQVAGEPRGTPAHRALPDARAERRLWLRTRELAEARARGRG